MNNSKWQDIENQITYWIQINENANFGLDVGYRDKIIEFLKEPMNDSAVEKIISKMQKDLMVLQGKEVSLYWVCGENQITIKVDNNSLTVQLTRKAE